MKKHQQYAPKPRNPASIARSKGALRTLVVPDKGKTIPRKSKHKLKDIVDE